MALMSLRCPSNHRHRQRPHRRPICRQPHRDWRTHTQGTPTRSIRSQQTSPQPRGGAATIRGGIDESWTSNNSGWGSCLPVRAPCSPALPTRHALARDPRGRAPLVKQPVAFPGGKAACCVPWWRQCIHVGGVSKGSRRDFGDGTRTCLRDDVAMPSATARAVPADASQWREAAPDTSSLTRISQRHTVIRPRGRMPCHIYSYIPTRCWALYLSYR